MANISQIDLFPLSSFTFATAAQLGTAKKVPLNRAGTVTLVFGTHSGDATFGATGLEGSNDNGTTWFDMLYDIGYKSSAAGTLADPTVSTQKKVIFSGGAPATGDTYVAIYNSIPFDVVRIVIAIAGGTSGANLFTAKMILLPGTANY